LEVVLQERTQAQALDELTVMRQRVAELEALEARRQQAELDREQLLYTLHRRNTQLQTAAQVSKSASTILDPAALISQAVTLIRKRFDFYYVGLFLLDEAGERAVLRAGTGEAGQQMLQEGHSLAVGGDSMISRCVAQAEARIALDVREPLLRQAQDAQSNDVGHEVHRFANPLLPHTRSEVALPLISRGQCIGALSVQSAREAAFSEQDVAALQTMADQLAIAITNARLYEAAQEEIAQREQTETRYRTLVQQAPIGVVRGNRAGNVTHVNPAALEILGSPGEQDTRKLNLLTLSNLVETGIATEIRRCMEEETSIKGEYQYSSYWGKESILRLHISPLRDKPLRDEPLRDQGQDVSGVLIVLEDVTEQRRLESQLLQSAKLASIGELAAGVAHEINNPINGIINYAQLVLNQAQLDEHQKGFVEGILREGTRVADIVRDLLTFARVETEAHSLACIPDILQATLKLSGQQLKKDGVILEIKQQPDLPRIKCRSQRIQQVFLNLISNARHALDARYPGRDHNKQLEIRIEQVDIRGQSFVCVTFHDRGVGIPAQKLSQVFTPFFTTKRPDEGTGLGLAVSYGIVQNHRGNIQVESVEGEYTIFQVYLPVDPGWEI
jgi:PAS domain S-box-containing protein